MFIDTTVNKRLCCVLLLVVVVVVTNMNTFSFDLVLELEIDFNIKFNLDCHTFWSIMISVLYREAGTWGIILLGLKRKTSSETFVHSTSRMTGSVVLPSELLATHTYDPASWRVTVSSVSRAPPATNSSNSRPEYQLYVIVAGLPTAVTLILTGWCSSAETVYGDVNVVKIGLSVATYV